MWKAWVLMVLWWSTALVFLFAVPWAVGVLSLSGAVSLVVALSASVVTTFCLWQGFEWFAEGVRRGVRG